MEVPKVTVLMPVCNGDRYLREAIDSILNQKYKDFEFIIIDDGSRDRSSEIIRSYKDQRIRFLQNERNLGIEKTLNRGIRESRGMYIARMDCDDISLPQRLVRQVDFMDSKPKVAACGSWVKTFGACHRIWTYFTDPDEIRCQLLFSSALAHPSVILRREMLKNSGLFFDEKAQYKRAEDYDLWARISKQYQLMNIGEVLLRYRIHDQKTGRRFKLEAAFSADRVRKEELSNLGMSFSEDEFRLHSNIATGSFESSLDFVHNAERWLNAVCYANNERQLYNSRALARVLSFHWGRICYSSSSLGFEVCKQFVKSQLSQNGGIRGFRLLLFFIKCFLKKKYFWKGFD